MWQRTAIADGTSQPTGDRRPEEDETIAHKRLTNSELSLGGVKLGQPEVSKGTAGNWILYSKPAISMFIVGLPDDF